MLLNGSAWTGRARKLRVTDHVVRVGWFASMSEALLVATTDGGDQVDLLIVPPFLAQDVAEHAMAKAADPANFERAPDLLAQAVGPAERAEPPRIIAAGVPEAVWDNEGGSARRSGSDHTD